MEWKVRELLKKLLTVHCDVKHTALTNRARRTEAILPIFAVICQERSSFVCPAIWVVLYSLAVDKSLCVCVTGFPGGCGLAG